MKSLKKYLNEKLQNKKFALEYQKASDDVDFALSLIQRREELQITQHDLATLTGIKQPMIARIEKGQIPTVPTLHKIAEALEACVIITGSKIVLEGEPKAGRFYKSMCEDAKGIIATTSHQILENVSIKVTAPLYWEKAVAGLTVSRCLNATYTNIEDHLELLEEGKNWVASNRRENIGNKVIVFGAISNIKEETEFAISNEDSFSECLVKEKVANAELALAA